MARIRGPAVAVFALTLLCGCGHGAGTTASSWVVFASDRDGRWDVYAIRPDGSSLIRVTGRRDEMEPQLATSPDGKKLAIVSSGGTTVIDNGGRKHAREGGDMYAIPYVSNDGHVRLASGEGPTVSPDGRHRAFVDRNGILWIRAKVAVARADGSEWRVLTQPGHDEDAYPNAWSSDGRRVLFTRGNSFGGGADLVQVWTVAADGHNARALTEAYPHGGENMRPVWFRGTLRPIAPLPPLVRSTRTGTRAVLRTRYLVGEVRTNRGRVAVLPLPHSPQTPRPTAPLLVWTAATGTTTSWPIPACAWPEGLLVDGSTAVFDCNNSCCDSVDESLLMFRIGDPVPFEAVRADAGGYTGGTFLAGYGLDAGSLLYGQSRKDHQRVVSSGLWRRSHGRRVRIGGLTGEIVGYSAGRLAVLQSATVAVFDPRHRPSYRIAIRLRAWEALTGRLRGTWTVPRKAHLDDVAVERAIFTAGRTVHVLDLTGGRQLILRFPAVTISSTGSSPTGFYAEAPLRADLEGDTLVVSYNVSPRSAEPGRVVVMHLR